MKYITILTFCFSSILWFPSDGSALQIDRNFVQGVKDSIIIISGSAFDSAWSSHVKKLSLEGISNQSGNIERYTIQVFSGTRKEAMKIYNELLDSTNLMLHFDEPNFKISVGLFSIKLAAEFKLKKWRKKYPQSFVVKSPK